MKILITGAGGQLGKELQKTAPQQHEIIACSFDTLDICNKKQLDEFVAINKPDYVINTAAYTLVDKAEQEKEQAYNINVEGAGNVARAAMNCGAGLVQLSTDYVFNGKTGRPYLPDDKPDPISVYGESKYKGELMAREEHDKCIILRTSWLYSSHGNNFVKTMLKLLGNKTELRVISDQVGTPTWTNGLAAFIWNLLKTPDITGTYHWTDAGVASWYDFTVAIMDEALKLNMLQNEVSVIPITTEEYPTPAKRPLYSVLDKTTAWALNGKPASHWRVSLRHMLEELKASSC